MEEVWKYVKSSSNIYEISNLGRVRSNDRIVKTNNQYNAISKKTIKGKILKPVKHDNGYYYVNVFKKQCAIHRLAAEAFIPNPDNLPQVNHKDGNKLNNNVDNLEWCSAQQNMQHAFKNGLVNLKTEKRKKSELENVKKATEKTKRKVAMYNKNNELIKIFESIRNASNVLKINESGIYRCLRGAQKEFKGYMWRYANE